MKRLAPLFFVGVLVAGVYAQKLVSPIVGKDRVPDADLIQIVKAEDSRNAEAVIAMLTNANSATRYRAALAAGRIGDERALDGLIKLLTDESTEVREMAAFAIGEVESIKGADVILDRLKRAVVATPPSGFPGEQLPLWPELIFPTVLSRLVEAAGKIAAANANTPKAKELGAAILDVLNAFADDKNLGRSMLRGATQVPRTRMILLGLTAVLRTRPEGAADVVAKFLTDQDPRIRADAGNTLARLRAKNANETLRKMVASDPDAAARANAARALSAAEDKEAVDILIKAIGDNDSRVRVSAIRALGAVKDAKAADPLLEYGEKLFAEYKAAKKPNFIPAVQNEFIEVATVLGRLLANTDNARADKLFGEFAKFDKGYATEVYLARVRVGPKRGDGTSPEMTHWRQYSTVAQMVGEFADIDPKSDTGKQMKKEAPGILRPLATAMAEADPATEGKRMMAGPDSLQAYAKFKTGDLGELSRKALLNKDVFMRAAAAGVLADLPPSKENVDALNRAFILAVMTDQHDNDAKIAILDAVAKLDIKAGVGTFLMALDDQDYLIRKKAFAILGDAALQKDFPGIPSTIENARSKGKDRVLPHGPLYGKKLGQILNTEADYRRALSRKNGSIKAVLTTEKGIFTIVFNPEEAPLTVDNWVKLAHTGYFNGLEVHRVVANFVMQDGDPRGDGNGGPGWSIRCEVNMLGYDREAVGMALSGKDTGGSQWFVTHSPQPHLDGGYTVFGHVNETDMKVVDNIVRGDKVLTVKIIGR